MKMNFSSFTIHIIEGYISSIYLVEYDNRILLLDSGCFNDVKRIEDYCRHVVNRPVSDIKLAVVSHMHPDHAGGAATLRSKYGTTIAAHKDVDRWYSGLGGLLQHKLDCYMALGVARTNKRNRERLRFNPIIHPDILLNDLQVLPFFEDWAVLHTPGHTLHDIVLYHQQEALLYIGDIICDVKGKMLLPLPVLFPTHMENSYDKLATLNSSTILMAHGGVKQPENVSSLFLNMKEQLNQPPNSLMRRVYRLSVFTPEIKRQGM
ncbi:MAG TPA: Zn-dependent hydrolase [Syntrophomonas sp.]|jgi:glyoxylase-like metal-dependent hydrolase (beta-lactamase superfamily II)|nr:Zn-dependent hydrolase [Syntrophomonas sp.]